MRMSVQQLVRIRCVVLWGLVFLLFSCNTTRHIEKRQTKEVYEALGLRSDRNDNLSLYKEATTWLHVRHVDGGTSRNGTDCSFLVYSLYKTVYHKTIERNSAAMLTKSCKRIDRGKLKEGDLVFFNTSSKSKSYINHVGLYLKDNKFLHSSTSKGVIVSDLEEAYYRKTWVCGGRVR
jgi:cell wall-associated NlpC family hydrolase